MSVKNLRNADDTVILARTHEDLETVINRIVTVIEEDDTKHKQNKIYAGNKNTPRNS